MQEEIGRLTNERDTALQEEDQMREEMREEIRLLTNERDALARQLDESDATPQSSSD